MSRKVFLPSHHTIVAYIALFVALGGTSYAAVTLSNNSILSRHIKNGQVKRSDLADRAVNAAKVADGSLLAKDFKAGQLPSGPAGPQGPKGDAGITTLKVRAATATGRVVANCQPSERATGGGAHSVNGAVVASAPAGHPDAIFVSTGITHQEYTPTSWTAAARDATGNPVDVTAWVVCAAP
jgi:hypothetical protein